MTNRPKGCVLNAPLSQSNLKLDQRQGRQSSLCPYVLRTTSGIVSAKPPLGGGSRGTEEVVALHSCIPCVLT